MAISTSISRSKKLSIFLNISFIFLLSLYLKIHLSPFKHNSTLFYQSSSIRTTPTRFLRDITTNGCTGLQKYTDNKYKCFYVKSDNGCKPKGYIDYLQVFYCNFGKFPLLGHLVLVLWLIVLFYLLGNTAASYFCSSLESLSDILKLSPTIAGVTLLSLGNGAPDVFASIVSFTRSGNGGLGLNSILGGAFFVSSIVVGIITIGRINLWGALCFVSIYFVYVCVVSAMHFFYGNKEVVHVGEVGIPLLGYIDEEKQMDKTELPLYLPRRLTIPVVSEESWSKAYAVLSVTLAPLLLASLVNTQRENVSVKSSLVTYLTAGLIGMFFGNLAYVTTKKSSPPKRCLFPWLAGGFLMSITWTYIIAEELVSLLVSLGHIIGINPSVLGLTVLAWGNSLGDLIANIAMAINGGADGAQIAISGCYAGPMFNVLMGLGLSLLFSSISEYPSSFEIPGDPSLYETLGFLMGGLLWALVILPKNNMRLDRSLGFGLLAIYLCFLFLRLTRALGLLNLHGSFFEV
uniref:Sodium/calcium exchanger membrane region domain-containing protein n=1 Tax=Fagus sylvatica TaxID=28930 RepID=A0A2N9IMJ7_FAGSY